MSDRTHDFARAVAVRQLEAPALDEATMREIALELGMTEADLLEARAEGSARKERARGLRQNGLLDDAIAELEQASAWNPLDVEVLTLLADTLVRRGRKTRSAVDLSRGRELALAALQAAPANTDAPAILQTIQMNPVKESSGGFGAIVGVAGIVLALVLAGGFFFFGF